MIRALEMVGADPRLRPLNLQDFILSTPNSLNPAIIQPPFSLIYTIQATLNSIVSIYKLKKQEGYARFVVVKMKRCSD
ncbi:hypothetical protein PanWU01x14_218240 [Parasponia andersonii]|uniref:Uncharacterized protein n=1 Tax=Parasponia andersonii TaxID=3476 RepID=A0A2P5BQS7_PARAD|nr:hypothetical protein PanWU01x14_218240 [Parasponia andersonii]